MTRAAAFVLASLVALAPTMALSDEPVIDHQPVECSVPERNPRICAYVLDDGEVKRVRVYFRAEKQDAYYWSEMAFDGIQFCSTLPVAKKKVKAIDYYVWSVDDSFETSRTRPHRISLSEHAPCAYPVIDEDPGRIANLVVHATSEKQGKKIKDFETRGIREFVASAKK